jgi:hypothetical protein
MEFIKRLLKNENFIDQIKFFTGSYVFYKVFTSQFFSVSKVFYFLFKFFVVYLYMHILVDFNKFSKFFKILIGYNI